MKCVICGFTEGQNINIDFPFFRHMDFAKIADKGEIFRCNKCYGLSFDYTSKKIDIDAIYNGSDYSEKKKTSYFVFENNVGKYRTPYEIRAEHLCRKINGTKPAILDMGCFDGKLLKEFRKRLPQAELYGFDVSPRYKQYFSAEEKIYFYDTDLSRIDAKFDLITIVNVINYIGDMDKFIGHLKRLLRKNGIIFIETMNIDKNPCQILYGDLYAYYNGELLRNLFIFYGMEFEILEAGWVPHAVCGIARVGSAYKGAFIDDRGIFSGIEYLGKIKNDMLGLCKKRKVKVLGTSLPASLIYSLVPKKIECFIDENPSKVGIKFNGLEVMHPHTLDRHDLLIAPYGIVSVKIKERFKKFYPCEIVCF